MRKIYLSIVFALFSIVSPVFAQFTEVAGTIGLDQAGRKDGGVSWGDFNGDGCPDLLLNTDDNSHDSRLFMSDCNLPNPSFTDVTATHAAGLLNIRLERSAIWADFNNDGYLDFARNDNPRFELYINKGPSASPPYSFGDASQNPNLVITNIAGGMNTEGFGWADYNEDGWLDLIVENHNYGIDIFQNPADGTANFYHVTPNGSTMGLPTGANTGDYMALADYNNNGTVDILARKQDQFDLWQNNGFGASTQFTANTSFNLQANNGNKGGVLFADFDNDGDFDIFWGDAGNNEILLQTAPNVFTATGEPGISAGVDFGGRNVDGVAAADIDNDGDIDLFLADRNGPSYLFLNNTPSGGALNFTRNNLGIDVDEDGEGCAFVDYDQDGDMDLYVNINNDNNQLWRNGANNNNYLKVRALFDLGGGLRRDDVGATVTLLDCFGNVMGGIRDVNGTRGHGSQDYPEIHFGLSAGPTATYLVRVAFTTKFGNRVVIDQSVVPANLTDQTLTITSTGATDTTACSILSEEDFFGLRGEARGIAAELNWEGVSGGGIFSVERSKDGFFFEGIGNVDAENGREGYSFSDVSAGRGEWHYRVRQVKANGATAWSETLRLRLDGKAEVVAYPNPLAHGESLQLDLYGFEDGPVDFMLYDARGIAVWQQSAAAVAGKWSHEAAVSSLSSGMYMLLVRQGNTTLRKNIVVR